MHRSSVGRFRRRPLTRMPSSHQIAHRRSACNHPRPSPQLPLPHWQLRPGSPTPRPAFQGARDRRIRTRLPRSRRRPRPQAARLAPKPLRAPLTARHRPIKAASLFRRAARAYRRPAPAALRAIAPWRPLQPRVARLARRQPGSPMSWAGLPEPTATRSFDLPSGLTGLSSPVFFSERHQRAPTRVPASGMGRGVCDSRRASAAVSATRSGLLHII